MDFGEVASALRTGVVDGANASTLETNQQLGMHDVASHETYPGFNSMPANQLTCSNRTWDKLPPDIQRMMEVGVRRAALDLAMLTEIRDKETLADITERGLVVHNWSTADRNRFRDFSRARWEEWKTKSSHTAALVDSHIAFMKKIGLVD